MRDAFAFFFFVVVVAFSSTFNTAGRDHATHMATFSGRGRHSALAVTAGLSQVEMVHGQASVGHERIGVTSVVLTANLICIAQNILE